jgi:hypothetical protein
VFEDKASGARVDRQGLTEALSISDSIDTGTSTGFFFHMMAALAEMERAGSHPRTDECRPRCSQGPRPTGRLDFGPLDGGKPELSGVFSGSFSRASNAATRGQRLHLRPQRNNQCVSLGLAQLAQIRRRRKHSVVEIPSASIVNDPESSGTSDHLPEGCSYRIRSPPLKHHPLHLIQIHHIERFRLYEGRAEGTA